MKPFDSIKEEIEELRKDPRNQCLHYYRKCSNQTICDGYSSSLLCPDYINVKHLESFKKYKL